MDALKLNFGNGNTTNFIMVLLMDAVMGWRHGDINQRGVLCFGIGLREKEV